MSDPTSPTIKNMQNQAEAGDLHSIAQLSVCYLLGHQVKRDVERGFLGIKKAADRGEIASQTLLATLYASGMGVEENWNEAYNWLVIAAQNGDPKAIAQINHFMPELKSPDVKITWQDVYDKLVNMSDGYDFSYTVHHSTPLVRTMESFLDKSTCDYVMTMAQPLLQQAYVNDGAGGAQLDESRTNSAMNFSPLDNDLVIQKINRKISVFLGQPVSYAEPLSVLHYKPGQCYSDHHDYFNPDFPAHIPHLKAGGQRIKTFLIYLNEGFSAGETNFPLLNWKFRGKQGEAIVFDNVKSDGGVIESSLHTGLSPETGEKWIISKWLKDKPQY